MSDVKSLRAGLALGLAFFSGMLSSSLPTPLYPLYRDIFNFSASQIMIVFGVYAVGVLLTLCITSRLRIRSEHYSRAIYAGLGCVTLSSLLMMFAVNLEMLAIARFITGAGSGILMAYVNRSLIRLFSTDKSNLAALTASAALVLGQALGPVISGNAIQFNLFELRLPFLVLLLTSVTAVVAVFFCAAVINQPVQQGTPFVQKSGAGRKSEPAMKHVFVSCSAIFLSWAMASTLMSQGPTLARSYFGVTDPQVISYTLSAFLAVAGITQFAMRGADHHFSLSMGIFAQLGALLIACASSLTAQTGLLLMAVLLEGFAYGAILVGAATIVNRMAVKSGKSQLVNLLYIMGYIGNWLPMILSLSMDHFSVKTALLVYLCLCIFVAALITLFCRLARRSSKASAPPT
ncbi:MFS transporter [Enterobacter hormaechei]|uniref:MFS transporter n=1 Tax=Enterobacter hormaechei TaxID=158836 RepID=UPI003908096D